MSTFLKTSVFIYIYIYHVDAIFTICDTRIDAEKKWQKTRRAILLFVLSTKTTKERFLLKLRQRNGNLKKSPFLSCIARANSTARKSLPH